MEDFDRSHTRWPGWRGPVRNIWQGARLLDNERIREPCPKCQARAYEYCVDWRSLMDPTLPGAAVIGSYPVQQSMPHDARPGPKGELEAHLPMPAEWGGPQKRKPRKDFRRQRKRRGKVGFAWEFEIPAGLHEEPEEDQIAQPRGPLDLGTCWKCGEEVEGVTVHARYCRKRSR